MEIYKKIANKYVVLKSISKKKYPMKQNPQMLSVVVLGHRIQILKRALAQNKKIFNSLDSYIQKSIHLLYEKGAQRFFVLGASGIDTWCTQNLVKFKDIHSELNITMVKSTPDQNSSWPKSSLIEHERLCGKVDQVITLSHNPGNSRKIFNRNEWVVNNSDFILAFEFPEITAGGFVQTLDYAKMRRVPMCIIDIYDLNKGYNKLKEIKLQTRLFKDYN